MTNTSGRCSHCQVYIARAKTGKCIVCSASPMTKKEIKEARIKHGIEEPKPERKAPKSKKTKLKPEKTGTQAGLFGASIDPNAASNEHRLEVVNEIFNNDLYPASRDGSISFDDAEDVIRKKLNLKKRDTVNIIDDLIDAGFLYEPSLGVVKLNNPPEVSRADKDAAKKARRTARKKRTHLNSKRGTDGTLPKKVKYRSPVTETHITEYFKILTAEYGEKPWMESRHYRDMARSRLESMLSIADEDLSLVDNDYEFANGSYGDVDGKRVRFVTLDQMTDRLEDIGTLTSIGLL